MHPISPKSLWTGRILTGLTIAFMLLDGAMKVLKAQVAVQGTVQLGYPESLVAGIGAALLVCTLFYAIPQTSIFGAILLTGYLGGAVATNVRVGAPVFSNILFPVYIALMAWGGLYLRDERLRAIVPFRS